MRLNMVITKDCVECSDKYITLTEIVHQKSKAASACFINKES